MHILDTITLKAGLYTLREAAKYAKIHPTTLRHWLCGYGSHPALRSAQIDKEDGSCFLTFEEFLELVAIRSYRVNYGVSLQKIREAIDRAKDEYDVAYPFASKEHRTYLVGTDLHIRFASAPDSTTQLTGRGKRQQSMVPCIEQYMEDIQFDEHGVCTAYIAYRYPSTDINKTPVNITMNPVYCFGEPVVGTTGYRARTLWQAAFSEGSIERTARCYDVTPEAVEAACRYCQDIEQPAAA